MNREMYLFIIWQNARFMEKTIVNDIKKKFELFQIYEITWTPECFANNLARFYGKKLPKGCRKEKETGAGSFLVLLVYDKNPRMSNGRNIAIMTTKQYYRRMMGRNLIHASDNEQETNENIIFLLGKNIKEIEKEESFFIPKPHKHDLVGCAPWSSIDEAIETVRKVPFTKVTPYKDSFLVHSRNASTAKRVLNASNRFKIPGRHKYYIKVGKTKYPMYLRKVS